MSLPKTVIAFVSTAGVFFVIGAYYQHFDVMRNIRRLEQRNAYAYFIRQKLYDLLGIFSACETVKAEIDEDLNQTDKLSNVMKYGFPCMSNISLKQNFVTAIDRRNSCIHWICERVDAIKTEENQRISTGNLRSASRSETRTVGSKTRSVSFSLEPVGPTPSTLIQSEASRLFFSSNIKPFLNRGFNTNLWEKLQTYAQEMANLHGLVYVYSGSIYLPKQMDKNWFLEFQPSDEIMVGVPTHFFKIIIVDPTKDTMPPYAEAYVVPNAPMNENIDVRSLLCDIRDIENSTGFTFFEGMERNFVNNRTESASSVLVTNQSATNSSSAIMPIAPTLSYEVVA